MKLHVLSTMAMALGFGISANAASLFYTFDTGATPGDGSAWNASTSFAWNSTYQAIQQVANAGQGGWTLGTGTYINGPEFDLNWPAQTTVQAIDDNMDGHLSFDLFVNSASFPTIGNANSLFLQFNIAANSGGSMGWTQLALNDGTVGTSQTWHYDFTFAQLGWGEGSANDQWYQLYFGSNSDAANPVNFFIDNIKIYDVPEPATLALAGMGIAGLFIFRRRKA